MTEKGKEPVEGSSKPEKFTLRDGLPREDIKVVIQELEALNLQTLREKYIPPEKKEKYRNNFSLFDRSKRNSLDFEELKEFLVSIGQMLPEDVLQEFFRCLSDGKGIPYQGAEVIIVKKLRDEDQEEQITEAFRIIDKEKLGSIDSEYFKELLMTYGFKWPEDKADEFMKDCDPKSEGRFEFGSFIKKIMKIK